MWTLRIGFGLGLRMRGCIGCGLRWGIFGLELGLDGTFIIWVIIVIKILNIYIYDYIQIQIIS